MTHDILQSDIELARRLRGDQRPDEDIIQALVHRGVDAATAAQLVDDLRSGKKVFAQSPAPAEFTPRRRSRSRSMPPEPEESPSARSPGAEPRRKQPAKPQRQDRKNSRVSWWIFSSLGGLALLFFGILLFQRDQPGTDSPEGTGPAATMPKADHPSSGAPAKATTASQKGADTPLVLELHPDGLHLGGGLVTRDSLLPAVARLLGVPTRTNRVAQTGTLIYAYDDQGLLIYSQPGGGTNSIILDCEATGGVNGTTSPFAGLLKMEDQVIGPDVDAATLTAIQELGLTRPGSSANVWNGRYHGLELVFAYLKTPQRLSLIEIDLE